MDSGMADQFRELEETLWRSETRFDDALMDRMFAKDFCEFGRSGRIYARHEMLFGRAKQVEIDATLPLPELRVRFLSGDIVQVMYVSEVRYGAVVERANRSSLWRRDGDAWVLCFHQGTPLT